MYTQDCGCNEYDYKLNLLRAGGDCPHGADVPPYFYSKSHSKLNFLLYDSIFSILYWFIVKN